MDTSTSTLWEFLHHNVWVGVGFFIMAVIFLNKMYEAFSQRRIARNWQERFRRESGICSLVWSELGDVEREIVRDVWKECKSKGVRFILHEGSKAPNPKGGGDVSGYFLDGGTEAEPSLCVAVGKDSESWIQVLLHESSHMDQWSEGTREWKEGYVDGEDVYDMMFQWIDGKRDFSDSQGHDVIRRCVAIELDCEKRTAAKLERYGMGKSVIDYIRKANAYIWSYCLIGEKRRWYLNPPYEVKSVWERMPERFMDIDRYLTMDWEMKTLFTRFCFLTVNERKEEIGI